MKSYEIGDRRLMQELPKVFIEFLGKKIELGGKLPTCIFCGKVTSYSYLEMDLTKPICLECSRKWKRIKRKMKTKNRR